MCTVIAHTHKHFTPFLLLYYANIDPHSVTSSCARSICHLKKKRASNSNQFRGAPEMDHCTQQAQTEPACHTEQLLHLSGLISHRNSEFKKGKESKHSLVANTHRHAMQSYRLKDVDCAVDCIRGGRKTYIKHSTCQHHSVVVLAVK